MKRIDDEWDKFTEELKRELYGEPSEPEEDMFYSKFSPITGEVVPGWNHEKWTRDRFAGCKMTTSSGRWAGRIA